MEEENELEDLLIPDGVMWVAWVNPDGRINTLQYVSTLSPPEGSDGDGNTVVYISEEIDTAEYMNLYYYDFDTSTFIEGPPKPHTHVQWNSTAKDWEPVESSYMQEVKDVRQRLLYLTDWVWVPDNNLDDPKKEEARVYREELRDFPQVVQDAGDFSKPVEELDWPQAPDFLTADTLSSRRIPSDYTGRKN